VPGLSAQLDTVAIATPNFPVISNVTAQPVTDPVAIRRLLVEQLTAPVRWSASMRTIVDSNIRAFVELGPGDVLCGLMKRIERSARCRALGGPAELEALDA
jgi:[acyl-carrier-protein] S-malonyltransferase